MTMEERSRQVAQLRDDQRNRYVDEPLPTVTVTLRHPERKGRVRAPHGTAVGSYRVSGSFQQGAVGTYSFLVTRVSLFVGSRNAAWMVRHSRKGTVDVQHFESPGQYNAIGGLKQPVYAFGPGTVFYGWIGNAAGGIGSAHDLGEFMEGVTF